MSITQQRQKIPFLLTILSLVSFTLLVAQNPRTESLTIADGLSQGMIFDIEQTDDGFLWFATKDGLNRYDGYNFKMFTNDPFNPFSIAGNEITSLLKDSQGNLWMTVEGRGLDVLEKTSGRFLHLPELDGLSNKFDIMCLVESPDSAIWAATIGGLVRIRWKTNIVIDNPSLLASATVEVVSRGFQPGKESFFNLAPNPDGTLIVSIWESGTYQYLPSENKFIPIFQWFGTLMSDNTPGRVWSLTDKRMFVIENGKGREIQGVEHPPYMIIPIGTGNLLWAAHVGNETHLYSLPEDEVFRTGSVANPNLVFKLKEAGFCPSAKLDRSGNLWLGTSGYGLQKTKLTQQPFRHFLKGKSISRISCSDAIYLGLGGISPLFGKLDEASNEFESWPATSSYVYQYFRAKNNATYTIADDSITGYDFLHVFKNGLVERKRTELRGIVYAQMTEDLSGNIWTGGKPALLMGIQASTGKIAYLDLSKQFGKDAIIYALYFDARQNLWVATTNGMAKLEIDKLEIDKFWRETNLQTPDFPIEVFQTDPNDPASLRYNLVTSFCADPIQPDRYLWVSTKGGGLNRLDKTTSQFRHFTSQNSGLPNDVVYGILPDDDGNLWMSTNRGLSRMKVDGFVFQNFRESDGLQGDEFNTGAFARSPDGRLLFGGVNGLTAFYPSEIRDRKSDAPVCITGLKINNLEADFFQTNSPIDRPIHQTKHLRLKHNQNLVTLEFALMDFVSPQENRFRYRLHGVDPDWVEAGTSHTANYAHLRPGSYNFEVQGSIGSNEWSAATSLAITVLPPWWATWWAYLGYSLLFCGVVFAGFYVFKKRLLLQNELKLEHEESNRLKELDTFKSRLFTNLTHEFRTPLTVILGMAERLMVDGGRMTETRAIEALDLIKRNGKNLLRLINQLLDLSKLENNAFQLQLQQGDIVPYLRYVTESFQTYANSKNLSLRFFTNIESLVMDFDPEQIKQVLTNLISNAVKFTPSGGEIKVKLEIGNWEIGHPANFPISQFLISVTDTGIGISEKNLPHIFDRFYQVDGTTTRAGEGTGIGLAHTEELVKIMGGSIRVESEFGKGASFFVALPIHQKAALWDSKEVFQTLKDYLPGNPLPENTTESTAHPLSDSSLPQLLIIEDSADVVVYLKSCLENTYQIDVAYNGKIGIEKAVEHIPDLIISDVMMPEKDGYQVCDTLKNDERTSHIPIILLTAKADAASRMVGLRRGADAYLSKPFNLEELLVRLNLLLDNQRRIAAHFSKAIENGMAPPLTDATLSEAVEVEDAFVKKVNEVIEANYADEDFALPQLCQKIGMSRSQLFRKMKAVTDTAPSDLIRTYRLDKAKMLLENEGLNVAEAAYRVGFKDPSYFSKLYQERFGTLPSATNK